MNGHERIYGEITIIIFITILYNQFIQWQSFQIGISNSPTFNANLISTGSFMATVSHCQWPDQSST